MSERRNAIPGPTPENGLEIARELTAESLRREKEKYGPDPLSEQTGAIDFSKENLDRIIKNMSEWSMNPKWTPEQTAAWRLRWFGLTPDDDERLREESRDLYSFDRPEREPFNDWPNGQGTYD